MKTIKEYELIGLYGDEDGEWVAGCSDLSEATHYAYQYMEDYDSIEIYEVTREKIMEIKNAKKN